MKELADQILKTAVNLARYISKILTVSIIVMSSPLWVMPYLIFHIYDIMEEI